MATLFVSSARDKARTARVQTAIDAGELAVAVRRPGTPCPRPADDIFSKPPFSFTRGLDIAEQIAAFGFDPRYLLPTSTKDRLDAIDAASIAECYAARSGGYLMDDTAAVAAPQRQEARSAAREAKASQSWVEQRVAQLRGIRGEASLASEARWHAGKKPGTTIVWPITKAAA